MSKCIVCNQSWEDHSHRVARRDFNSLNPDRDTSKKDWLNEAQCRRLRELFVNENGELANICWNHLMEFASVGKMTVSKLVKIWEWEVMRNRGDPDAISFEPTTKKKRVASNKTDDDIISDIVTFCYSNSSVVPNEPKVRRFEGHVPNLAEASRLYNSEFPDGAVSYSTFCRTHDQYCPHINKFKHTHAACNTCCEYFAALESYTKWRATVSTQDLETPHAKSRIKSMEDAQEVRLVIF